MLRKTTHLVMVSTAQLYLLGHPSANGIHSGGVSFPEGIPSEQKTKDLLRMTAVSAPRRTMFPIKLMYA